ncbi:MAG: T9SS type A sorting domain-containing protein [Bacteroidales bacterium]|nr:T9SS type A sorting domain-containing protein [Bacteroidales bacterium]
MKQILLLATILIAMAPMVKAQTFTESNADGVEIQYTVTENDEVKVVSNDYSGRVVVPATVSHEGTTYTVTAVGMGAFQNRSELIFVSLPATVISLGNLAFSGSNNLDTLELLSPMPPHNQYGNDFNSGQLTALFGNNLIKTITVMVPDGSLSTYRKYWEYLWGLSSPSAVPLTIMNSPRIQYLYLNGIELSYWVGKASSYTMYFEVGDTTKLQAIINNADSLLLGWGDYAGGNYIVTGADTLQPTIVEVAYESLSAQLVSTPMKVHGLLGYLGGTSHYHFPANSTLSPLFANGLWIAGSTEEMLHVAASRFSCGDYRPGPLPIDGSCQTDLQTCNQFNRVWKVTREDIDDFIAHVGTEGYSIPENILSWPANGPDGGNYAAQLAPYYDANDDGVYDPHNGDYPLIRGDRMLYSIINDVTGHPETMSDPMGLEIHVSAYTFVEPDNNTSTNSTVFQSYRIINRSSNTYNNCYVGAFADFDIGYAYDDYIGCDVKRGMGYAYNGFQNDSEGTGSYGDMPPAQSCTILGGPRMQADGMDNPKIDIGKMQLYFPTELATYLNADGTTYDTARLTADADLYYPLAWYFTPGDELGNNAINGAGFGNGIADDERMGMNHFLFYNNGNSANNGEPSGAYDYFLYLKGYWKNGQQMHFGGDAAYYTSDLPCRFMYPDDSDPLHWGTDGSIPEANADDWNEATVGNPPGDRRGLMSSGPFSLLPGEEITLDLAFSTAFGTNGPWSSVEMLQLLTDDVRQQFVRDTTFSGKPFTYRPYSAPITGITTLATQPSVRVYPNPATERVTVSLGEGRAVDVALYDIRGRMLQHIPAVRGTVVLNTSTLPAGIYILHCGYESTRLVIR